MDLLLCDTPEGAPAGGQCSRKSFSLLWGPPHSQPLLLATMSLTQDMHTPRACFCVCEKTLIFRDAL